jgi:hypothetical protein
MSAELQDELVQEILQEAWDKLLKAREDGRLSAFNTLVPAQIVSLLDNIYDTQLTTYRALDQATWKNKRFSIAVAYRMSIQNTVGLEYFMEQMNDVGKMKAIDKLIKDLSENIDKENKFKRMMR